MRTIVSDSSCLIDLRKTSLLDAFLRLRYQILLPDTLFEDDLLKFTSAQKQALISAGVKMIDLPGETVLRALHVVRDTPQVSIHDAMAFSLAQDHAGCILVTGDRYLPVFATSQEIEVHGVLWIVDEIHKNDPSTAPSLYEALLLLSGDHATTVPRRELATYLKRYGALR